MLVVTAGSGQYRYEITIRHCEEKCKEYGYKFEVYDLGGLGFGIPVEDPRVKSKFRTVRCGLKPEIILDAMNHTDEEFVAWIDGDATLIGGIDEVFDGSYDVGVTVRPKRHNKKTSYINAGVLFFKNNPESKAFIKDWIAAMPDPSTVSGLETKPTYYVDQMYLENDLILPNTTIPLWDDFGSVHTIHGARVKIFDCKTYNNFWCMKAPVQPPNGTKILHFKGHRTHRLPSYLERFELE